MKGAKRKPRRYDEPMEAWLDYPRIHSTLYYGFPAYKVRRKVFCFYITREIVAIRLPPQRVQELIRLGEGKAFGTFRGDWPEWLVLEVTVGYFPSYDYSDYFQESFSFALGRKSNEYRFIVSNIF
jgi:hypothetical protein